MTRSTKVFEIFPKQQKSAGLYIAGAAFGVGVEVNIRFYPGKMNALS